MPPLPVRPAVVACDILSYRAPVAKDGEADDLRAMAAHRGYRLIHSRRRKPGAGDYGRYGLADPATGEPLFGIAGDGSLLATAAELADHLRGSAAATWRDSADATPDPPAPRRPEESRPPARDDPKAAAGPRPAATAPRRTKREPARPTVPKRTVPPVAPPPVEPPAPRLTVRLAKKADAPAIAALLNIPPDRIMRHIAAQARAKAPLLVADRGGVIGCLGWHVIPLPDGGTIGRIVTLNVAGGARRQGIGRALVDRAAKAMQARGCTTIEAMSDIEVRNAHGFCRAIGLSQTSYRFARAVERRRRKQSAE